MDDLTLVARSVCVAFWCSHPAEWQPWGCAGVWIHRRKEIHRIAILDTVRGVCKIVQETEKEKNWRTRETWEASELVFL